MKMKLGGLSHSADSIHAAALTIGGAGLLSRVLGIFRDRLLAAHFGAGRALDIYYAAFQIPDFLFTVFLLGAASAAIIPVLTGLERRDPASARRFVRELAAVFFVVSLGLSAAAIFAAPQIVRYLAPGFSPADAGLMVVLTRIMMASPVLLGMSNIVSAVLQAHRRFLAFALSSVFYNLGIIFGIFVFLPLWGLVGLGVGVILGAGLHLLIQLPSFFKLGFVLPFFPLDKGKNLYRMPYRIISDEIKGVFKVSLPRVVALSASTISDIILVAVASGVAPGSIAVFKFADNLRFVPIGLFGISFAAAAFPVLTSAYEDRSASQFYLHFFGALRSILFWILPVAVFFYVLRAQIVRVALGAGAFSWHDTRLTAGLLGIMTVAIFAESLSSLLIRAFYALGDTRTPLFINVGTAAAAVACGVVFVRMFGNPRNPFLLFLIGILRMQGVQGTAVFGIALAVAGGAALDFVFLFWGLRRSMRRVLGRRGPAYADWRGIAAMCAASLVAGLAAFGMLRAVNYFVTLERFWSVFIQGAAASAAGCAVYGGILYVLKNREIFDLIRALRRHAFRLKILPAQWSGE